LSCRARPIPVKNNKTHSFRSICHPRSNQVTFVTPKPTKSAFESGFWYSGLRRLEVDADKLCVVLPSATAIAGPRY
jgi:hypothetical protein